MVMVRVWVRVNPNHNHPNLPQPARTNRNQSEGRIPDLSYEKKSRTPWSATPLLYTRRRLPLLRLRRLLRILSTFFTWVSPVLALARVVAHIYKHAKQEKTSREWPGGEKGETGQNDGRWGRRRCSFNGATGDRGPGTRFYGKLAWFDQCWPSHKPMQLD